MSRPPPPAPGGGARAAAAAAAAWLAVGLSSGPGAAQPAAEVAATPDTLTLERALRTAAAHHPGLAAALAREDAAAAALRAGWGALLPTAGASLGFARNDFRTVTFPSPEGASERLEEPLESVSKGALQSLTFRWDLLQGGRRIAELRSGSAARSAAGHRLTATQRTVVATVKRAYYEALKQERLMEVAARQLEGRRRDLEVARRRYEIAAVDRTDVLGAEIALGEAELALVDAERAARAARRALRTEMGLDPHAPAEEEALRDVAGPPPAAGLDAERLVRRALEGGPELAALSADAEAARASLWAARATYLPTISIGYSLSRSESLGPEGDFFVFDPSNRNRSLSVSASWNLFDGFAREAQTAAASSQTRQVEAELAGRRLAVEREVRDLVEEIESRARRLDLQERNFALARQRVDMTREQYRLGTAEYVQLLQAIEQLTGAERALIQERYDYVKAWADLEERVGTVSPPGDG